MSEAPNHVTVLFFSVLREKLGRRDMEIEFDEPLDAGRFLQVLYQRIPVLSGFRGSIRLAVNREYADESTLICPGDEVAVITPTSGG